MTRSAPALIAAAVAFGCSPAKPGATLHVVPSSAKDDVGACIGVVGFTATLTGAATSPVTQLRTTPVLSDSQCGVEPLVIDGIGTDTPVTVDVDGYDSAHSPRVGGNAILGTIGATESETLTLTSTLVPVQPVLVVNRTALIAGAGGTAHLADIQRMVVETTGSTKSTVLVVDVNADSDTARYFQASEPGAFAVNVWNPAVAPPAGYSPPMLADGQAVTVTFTTSQGTLSIPRRTIRYNRLADGTFTYFEIQ
jgi:hypothetical protein